MLNSSKIARYYICFNTTIENLNTKTILKSDLCQKEKKGRKRKRAKCLYPVEPKPVRPPKIYYNVNS